jgi:hypothetical protein
MRVNQKAGEYFIKPKKQELTKTVLSVFSVVPLLLLHTLFTPFHSCLVPFKRNVLVVCEATCALSLL